MDGTALTAEEREALIAAILAKRDCKALLAKIRARLEREALLDDIIVCLDWLGVRPERRVKGPEAGELLRDLVATRGNVPALQRFAAKWQRRFEPARVVVSASRSRPRGRRPGSRARARSPGGDEDREPCRGCGRSLEGERGNARWCKACRADGAQNRENVANFRSRRRAPSAPERIENPSHAGEERLRDLIQAASVKRLEAWIELPHANGNRDDLRAKVAEAEAAIEAAFAELRVIRARRAA